MRYVKIAGEACLELFCSWTLAYHLCLLVRLPALAVLPVFLILFSLMLHFSSRSWKRSRENAKGERRVLLALVALALVLGVFAVTANRPDPDDFMLFYRAEIQSNALTKPFYRQELSFDVPGVPVLTVLHLMTSYEMLAAFTGRLFHPLHLDQLWVYQVGMAFAAAVMFPFFYFLLYREYGAGEWASVAGTACAALFLFLDGNTHRSFGNFAFVRMWQGKAIVFTILLPATILLARSYLTRPSGRGLARLAMLGICGVGLSDAGVYLLPVLVLALSVSYTITQGLSAANVRRMVLLWISMVYPLAIGGALLAGWLPEPKVTSVFGIGYPSHWWENLGLVIDSRSVLNRDVLILVLGPPIALKYRDAFFFIVLGAILCLIFANPVTGPIWVEHILPASFWRLAYLFPIPFSFGLAASSLVGRNLVDRANAVRVLVVLILAFSLIHAMTSTTVYWVSFRNLSATRFLHFKSPIEYNLPPNELAFARSVSNQLQDKTILGPEQLNGVMGLINPSIKFDDSRWDYTILAFDNLGMHEEGLRRMAAAQVASTCQRSALGDAALLKSVQNGVNAIIVRDCDPGSGQTLSGLIGLIDTLPGSWRMSARSNGYVLFLREPPIS